jgi:hypothetical protein
MFLSFDFIIEPKRTFDQVKRSSHHIWASITSSSVVKIEPGEAPDPSSPLVSLTFVHPLDALNFCRSQKLSRLLFVINGMSLVSHFSNITQMLQVPCDELDLEVVLDSCPEQRLLR